MNDALASETPASTLSRMGALLWDDPDNRSIAIGVLAVLIVLPLEYISAGFAFKTRGAFTSNHRQATPREFNIEIAPDTFVKPVAKPPPPDRFVETNPNAPDNVPDKTNNFSDRNQQVAQEKPQADAHNDHPQLDGQKEIHSSQIVTGQLSNPVDRPAPLVPPAPPEQQIVTAKPRQMQNPLTGFEKTQGEDVDSVGSNIAKIPINQKPIPEKIDGSKTAPLVDGLSPGAEAIDPRHPQARPQLEKIRVRPAIFEDNQFGTSNIGLIGVNAKWSSYGAYLSRMMDAVQAQWDRILIESQVYPPPRTHVDVKFRIDSKGQISEVIDVQSDSSIQGKDTCLSALTSRAPYGDWPDDMIAALGTSQEMTFRFYFQ
jgi:hypothetical protein